MTAALFSTGGNVVAAQWVRGGDLSALGNIWGNGFISTTGNITTSNGYFLGNGALLTGVITSVANINNGTTNVSITSANANVTVSVSTVANVVTISPSNVSVNGNIQVGNISLSGNIVDSGALNIISGANGNIALSANGTGIVTVSSNVSVSGNIEVGNITGNAAPGSTRTFAVGYMTIPVNATNTNYTLTLADQAELIYSSGNSITVTIPANANVAFPVGAVIAFAQYGGGAMTIAAQAGVTLALVGSSFTGNRILTSVGMASATQVATNTWLVTGTNVT
jgi:hypothetical protein